MTDINLTLKSSDPTYRDFYGDKLWDSQFVLKGIIV